MDDLIKFGEVQRGTITGITLQPMTSQVAEQLGAPDTRGVVVVSMEQRSEAYVSGMRPGDIIVSVNGTKIDDAQQFSQMLADAKIGTMLTLGILRQGKEISMKVPVVKSTRQVRRR
jgi:serine protease Do